jgi:flagellar protein FlaG
VVSASKQQESDNSGAENQQSSEQRQPTMKDVSEINKVINQNTIAEFGYNEPTNRITIKIKDKETDEVIKEIPSEKALEMLAKAWELAGIMVDEKR